MNCRRAFDIDLAAFLRDPRAGEWGDFRAHYPTCPDCATEVRAWTELEQALRSEGLSAEASHPPEERLLQFAEEPPVLRPAELQAIERHLTTCSSCADELATLRKFDFASLERTSLGVERWRAQRALAVQSTRSELPAPTLAQRVWRAVLHPALGYGLAALLLVALLARGGGPEDRREEQVVRAGATPARVAAGPTSSPRAGRGVGAAATTTAADAARPALAAPRPTATAVRIAAAPRPTATTVRMADAPRATTTAPRAALATATAVRVARAPDATVTPRPTVAATRAQERSATPRRTTAAAPRTTATSALEGGGGDAGAIARREERAPQPAAARASRTADAPARLARAATPVSVRSPEGRGMAPAPSATAAPRGEAPATVAVARVTESGTSELTLGTGAARAIASGELGSELLLHIPLSPEARRAPAVQIHVRGPGERREVIERLAPGSQGEVAVRLRRGWLVPGAYRVALEAVGAEGKARPLAEYDFTVR